MNILLQLDGLLWRFGDVVPDAIAMMGDMAVIDSRLRASGRHQSLRVQLFRVAGDHFPASEQKNARIKTYFDFSDDALEAVSELCLSDTVADDLVLTTSSSVYRQCREHQVPAIHIGDTESDREYVLPFLEVKRGLEERLRIPTARPMRAGVRKGGLLLIECPKPDAAVDQALAVIRQDRNADWLVVDNRLILYTEDPDLEDSLETRPDVRRLSFGVNKQSLIVEIGEGDADTECLLTAGRLRLRDLDSGNAMQADGAGQVMSWNEARRRLLSSDGANVSVDSGPTLHPLSLTDTVAVQTAERITSGHGRIADAIRDTVVAELDGNLSVDIFPETKSPACVTWMTDAEVGTHHELAVFVYRGVFDSQPLVVNVISSIVHVNRWILALRERRPVLHCLMLSDAVDVNRILTERLFDDESNRLSHIVEFNDLTAASERTRIEVGDETRLTLTTISGGGWCQPPFDHELLGEVQDALATVVISSR